VLIGDEQCFIRIDDQRDLNDFEQPDLEEIIHWAWDTTGRKYKLVWLGWRVGVYPELALENGVAEFRAAIKAYENRLMEQGIKKLHHPYCQPSDLLSMVAAIEQRTARAD
jgi:hypothetical protein